MSEWVLVGWLVGVGYVDEGMRVDGRGNVMMMLLLLFSVRV